MEGDAAVFEQGDAGGDALQVAGDVGAEDDRAVGVVDDFQERAEELAAGRGVEAGDRLVEDQELRLVAEGQDDAESLELADREGADAVFHGEAPAVAEGFDQRAVPGGVEGGGVVDGLADAHPGVADHFLGDVAEAGLGVGGEVPGVFAEDGDLAGGGAEEAEGALDERAFSAAVLAQEAEDRAGLDGEVDAGEDLFVRAGMSCGGCRCGGRVGSSSGSLAEGGEGVELGDEGVEDGADLIGREAELLGAVEDGAHELGEFGFAFGQAAGDGGGADAHALAADAVDEAFDLKAGVGLGDGHGVDVGGLGDLADAGQEVAGAELAAGDEGADLVDELAVDGDAGGWVELEESRGQSHGVLL